VALTSRDPDRLVLFTDAVVAIAITLLVLPLVESISEHKAASAIDLFDENWTRMLSFLLSFVVIAGLWRVHHQTFEHVKAYNTPVIWLNMAWLLTIVFLPFPTGMVGDTTYGDEHFTKALYVGTILAASLAQTLLILVIHNTRDVQSDDNPITPHNLANAFTASFLLTVAFLLATFIPATGYFSLLLMLLSRPVTMVWARIPPSVRPNRPNHSTVD
jgi:uncharacterized membrane protein